MAVTNEATEVALSPQRDYRGLIRAIVAVLAAFVIGTTIGNVIDGSDENTRAATEGGEIAPVQPVESAASAETFSPELVRALAQRPAAPAETFSPELVRALAQRPQAPAIRHELTRDQIGILLDNYGLPEAYRQDLAARVARGADLLPAQRAAADRLQGLAEAYAEGLTTGSVSTVDDPPTDIWQVRSSDFVSATPNAAARQAATDRLNGLAEFYSVPGPAGLVPDRPHGMQ